MSKKKLAITLLRVILGGVFIFSAISKLIAPGLFEITIIDQGIIESREIAAYLGRLLIALELFIGIALLQTHYLKRIVLPATLLTLIGFTGLLFYSYFSGDNSNCGCFGEIIKMSPIEAILKNLVLIVIGIYLLLNQKHSTWNIYIPLIILIISFSTVFILAPIKSYEDLIFSKYTNFENEGRVDLSEGNKLVAIFFIDCEHCIETARNISIFESKSAKLNNLYILFAGEETDSVQTFLDATNIQHPYLRINIEEFFDLIGSAPPRIYWLQNGKAKEFWDKNFIINLKRYKKYFLE
jgi:Methylamine utilisation protein MauE